MNKGITLAAGITVSSFSSGAFGTVVICAGSGCVSASETRQVLLNYTGGSQRRTNNTKGQHFLGISRTGGERFAIIKNPATSGTRVLRQLRLGGVSAVPGPGTWMTLTAGLGITGVANRRRRRLPSMITA